MDGCSKQTIELALDMRTLVSGSIFCVTERWIETADYPLRRSSLCARNSILQMICLALKFPCCILVITSSACAAKRSGCVTVWLNSLPPYLSFSFLLPLCPVMSARTRYRGSRGRLSEEPWRSRTCKWRFGNTSCACVCVCGVHEGVCLHAHLSLAFHRVCKCAQPPCARASIFHCVKCQVPPACYIDWHRCSLAAVCVCMWVWGCAVDVTMAFALFSLIVLP